VLPRPPGYATVTLPLPDGGLAGGGYFVIPLDGGVPVAGRSSYVVDFPGLTSALVRQGGVGGTGPVILTLQLAQGASRGRVLRRDLAGSRQHRRRSVRRGA